ncbi:MAG: hypothetical protein H6752_08500 [Candidatus Omnitrophica bacterium]|nr:hypothetical protein [Candidatus Omnitrophota bacterium]
MVVFFGYWFVLDRISSVNPLKRLWLLAASYLFYISWNLPLVSLLIISSVVDFVAARMIDRTGQKRWLMMSLVTNLGILGFFKYFNFFAESVVEIFTHFGVTASYTDLNIILPLGISFYTFQTMSYTIDVYRGKYKPYGSFLDFCLYVAFFPQLIAGPIVRADTFGYQLRRPRGLHWANFYTGSSRFIFGVFKKVVLANQAAAFSDTVFADPRGIFGTDVPDWRLRLRLSDLFRFLRVHRHGAWIARSSRLQDSGEL